MNPNEVVTYGAGICALALIFWFMRGWLEVQRQKSEKNLAGEVTLLQALQTQMNSLYERNKELTDRYHSAMQDALKLATTHGEEVMRAVENVRRETHDAVVRVHTKLEQTQEDLKACQLRHEECDEKVEMLEQRINAVSRRQDQ